MAENAGSIDQTQPTSQLPIRGFSSHFMTGTKQPYTKTPILPSILSSRADAPFDTNSIQYDLAYTIHYALLIRLYSPGNARGCVHP